jgi:vacuolar-type H+-ATPase subunit I/STV1
MALPNKYQLGIDPTLLTDGVGLLVNGIRSKIAKKKAERERWRQIDRATAQLMEEIEGSLDAVSGNFQQAADLAFKVRTQLARELERREQMQKDLAELSKENDKLAELKAQVFEGKIPKVDLSEAGKQLALATGVSLTSTLLHKWIKE